MNDAKARDALIGRERIRGASRMIAEGTEAASVTPEQISQVAQDVELFVRAHKIDRKAVAKALGYSPGVISEFLKGGYAGNKGLVAIQLEQWLVEEEERRSRPTTTQFVWTNVAMEIKAAANYCLDYRKIGLVFGPDTAGLGKTTALRAIHQELGPRRSSLVTIDKVDANPTGLLKKISVGMHIEDRGSNRARFERIVEKLNGRSHLLLVDQVHNLREAKGDKPLYILADLYDATQTAQLWSGTADLVTYLDRQRSKAADESLAQIRSRIMPCIDLMAGVRHGGGDNGEPLVTIEQVVEMFAKNKLRLVPTTARFLCKLANLPDSGGIRLCVQIVEYATMMGEISGAKSIDVPLLQAAMRRSLLQSRAEALLSHTLNELPMRAARTA
ncbi:AAA family ATPase [Humisphaera borealis]|uniref:AAA family ATPase n=1 Tax=Humisphaera borealis TaxID=2807512 RepID=A0A7M2WZT5_9BACT|nr:AAA family ATPase [Humisphaera borealis]QOV90913.1 AAA family ATPase [Humisphaera borealis]